MITTRSSRRRGRWLRWFAVVALVLLGAVAGFVLRGLVYADDPGAPAPTLSPTGSPTGSAIPPQAQATHVVKIVDGDTLDTPLGRVRLYGIDTPEVGEEHADEATQWLRAHAPPGTKVWLWQPPGSDAVDRYGRLVRIVILADGSEVNRGLASAGLARAFRTYSTRYVPEEEQARADDLGIWSGKEVVSDSG